MGVGLFGGEKRGREGEVWGRWGFGIGGVGRGWVLDAAVQAKP